MQMKAATVDDEEGDMVDGEGNVSCSNDVKRRGGAYWRI